MLKSENILLTKVAQDTAILNDDVDLHSGPYFQVWTALDINPNLNTYFKRSNTSFYRTLGSIISLVPNHMRYPFNETWMREAMAYAIDYDKVSLDSIDGYWERSSQGFLSSDSPSHTNEYNQTIQDTYGISYNPFKARQILYKHCDNSSGNWITRANQSNPGITLGLYDILTIQYWTDIVTATELMADSLTNIGITSTKLEVTQRNWYDFINNQTFDLAQQNQGPHLLQSSYSVLGGLRGTHDSVRNASSWYDAQADAYEDLYEGLEGIAINYIEAASIASQMQEILAVEIPEIPVCNNGFWYLYSTKYWDGWINIDNEYNQPATVYTVDTMAIKARLYLNLRSNYVPPTTTTTTTTVEPWDIPWYGLEFFIILGVVSTIILVAYKKQIKN